MSLYSLCVFQVVDVPEQGSGGPSGSEDEAPIKARPAAHDEGDEETEDEDEEDEEDDEGEDDEDDEEDG